MGEIGSLNQEIGVKTDCRAHSPLPIFQLVPKNSGSECHVHICTFEKDDALVVLLTGFLVKSVDVTENKGGHKKRLRN